GPDKKPVPGVKIPVLPPHEPLVPSPSAPPVTLPPAAPLSAWPQPGAGPRHDPGSVLLPPTLRESWRARIGAGGTYRRVLHVEPVIAAGMIFTMDGNGFVDAFSVESGSRIWRRTMRPKHDNSFAFGGGLAFDHGTLYVATGFGQIRALDPATGHVRWQKPLGQPARSAPTIGGGQIFLILLDNTLLSLDAGNGAFNWRFPSGSSVNSMLGAGAPAYDRGIVTAGFGTGLLVGINAASGSPVWEQSLAAGYEADNPLNVSSITANPLIIQGLVIATGLAGSTVAFDLRSGRRIWARSGGGSQTPAAAGDWLFLLTSGQHLAAIHVPDGAVGWVTQLPAFLHPKSDSGPLAWHGPLLAGNALLLTGDDRRLLVVDAITGRIASPPERSLKLNGPADLPPIAAAGKMFVLTRNAVLAAYS
ncbi:MAG TPA: PQQ-binding-like beta-propeller repeat protein, partial [Acetobacteraceae bacterium]|nr:PQQ-binding-like beta-propeller repeat protein [Acetobacteraceae bacterium]